MELIDLFLTKNAPLTIGVIGNNIGSDTELVNFLKERTSLNMMNLYLLEIMEIHLTSRH